MHTFGTHIFKNLALATVFITLVLTAIIMLIQSLRFLEIIIQAGAPITTFLTMIMYALPRFLETILPLSVFAAILFLYIYGNYLINKHAFKFITIYLLYIFIHLYHGFILERLAKPKKIVKNK